jgi:16S rRNA (cytosine1402-N4)-methyltransferase
MMTDAAYHIPVLLEPTVDLLNLQPGGTYVDVTFGGGGHSRRILEKLGAAGRLLAFDRDRDARQNLLTDSRLTFIPDDFRHIETLLPAYGAEKVDGILADLGVSSHQFDTAERGFSFRFEAPLDMRMNQQSGPTAADLLNESEEEELLFIFRRYGEVPNARKLVRALISQRSAGVIKTTGHFETVIRDCIPPRRRNKYLAQVFQALRIAVNREMESLEALLKVWKKITDVGNVKNVGDVF